MDACESVYARVWGSGTGKRVLHRHGMKFFLLMVQEKLLNHMRQLEFRIFKVLPGYLKLVDNGKLIKSTHK